MKLASLRDSLNHIRNKADNWPIRITRFSYNEVPGIGSGEVFFTSPLTVITGANSIGKTTFLRSIWLALDSHRAAESELTLRKVRGGHVEIDVTRYGIEFKRREAVAGGTYSSNEDFNVFHLDSAETIIDLQKKMFSLGDYEDIINGAPERILDADELKEVSFLTRRAYVAVKVFEVEVEQGLTAPFFEATYSGSVYDTRHMGSGEYAALFTWWMMGGAPKGSVILIEEPETFLSSLNQESLLKYLIFVIDKKKLAVILTTHSGHLLHYLSNESIRYLGRSGANCSFIADPHPTSLESIGIYIKPDVFVYVEDTAAQIVARLLLERFDPTLARRCQVEAVGGEAVITKQLLASMGNPFGLQFVGWYDGDQEGRIPDPVSAYAALLPGSEPFEIAFRHLVASKPEEVADAFANAKVNEIMSNLEGQDAHDWSSQFSKAIGRDHESVLAIILTLWLAEPGNNALAEKRIGEFKAASHR